MALLPVASITHLDKPRGACFAKIVAMVFGLSGSNNQKLGVPKGHPSQIVVA